MSREKIRHGRYCLFEKDCILLFETRSKLGRMIHVPSGWARDLELAKDRLVIRSILEDGSYFPSSAVPTPMALKVQ